MAIVGSGQGQSVDKLGEEFAVEQLQRRSGLSGQTILSEAFWEGLRDRTAADSVMQLRAELHARNSRVFRCEGISNPPSSAVSSSARVAELDTILASATKWYTTWGSMRSWRIK